MKKFFCWFAASMCFAFTKAAVACPIAAAVVSAGEVVVPAQPIVAVQALAVPSVAVISPTVLAAPVVAPTVIVDEVVHRRIRPFARIRANRVRVNVR